MTNTLRPKEATALRDRLGVETTPQTFIDDELSELISQVDAMSHDSTVMGLQKEISRRRRLGCAR